MPEYIVKTGEGRNLIIAADYYKQDTSSAVYNFYKSAEVSKKAPVLVGSVNAHQVLAVLEFEEAYQADFYDDEDEEDHDDTCLDCLLDNFVESSAFFDSVWSIVDFYLSPPEPPSEEYTAVLGEPRTDIPAPSFPVPETPTAVPEQVNEPLAKLEYRSINGEYSGWGVVAEGYFLPFGENKDSAVDSAASYKKGEWSLWGNFPLSETELAEVPSE